MKPYDDYELNTLIYQTQQEVFKKDKPLSVILDMFRDAMESAYILGQKAENTAHQAEKKQNGLYQQKQEEENNKWKRYSL